MDCLPLVGVSFCLELSNVNINAEAVYVFIVSTISNKPPRDLALNLSNNPLGYDGQLAIIRILRSETCPIIELDISNTDLTTPVNTESHYHNTQLPKTSSVLNLGPAIKNSRLTELYLHNNNFSGDRALILAECVRVCQSLERLYCVRCSLTSSEIIKILGHLRSNCSSHKLLRKWDLDNNSIGDEGVNALIDSLPQLFPKLKEMKLMKNLVSGEVKQRLEKILKVIISQFFPFIYNFLKSMSVALVSLIQVNKDERKSHEKAERKRLEAQLRDDIEKMPAELEKASGVCCKWERTCSLPQSEEVCLLVLFILLIVVLMFILYHSCS